MKAKQLNSFIRLCSGVFLCTVLSIAQPLQNAAQQQVEEMHINAPFVLSPEKVVDAMLRLADVKPTDTVYDLGCGDGRIVIQAASAFGAKGVGVDINPERVLEARKNAEKAGVKDKVSFIENDIFKTEVQDATVVTLYLLPDMNARLQPKLLKELKPGSRVVSHSFTFPDWKPEKHLTVNGSSIYLWIVPSR